MCCNQGEEKYGLLKGKDSWELGGEVLALASVPDSMEECGPHSSIQEEYRSWRSWQEYRSWRSWQEFPPKGGALGKREL